MDTIESYLSACDPKDCETKNLKLIMKVLRIPYYENGKTGKRWKLDKNDNWIEIASRIGAKMLR